MQVVVSIQGLILVPKPYFNEAGFEKQSGSSTGEHNAGLYNEQAFLLTLKSAVHLLRRPLTGFEDFIKARHRSCVGEMSCSSRALEGSVR